MGSNLFPLGLVLSLKKGLQTQVNEQLGLGLPGWGVRFPFRLG